MTIKASGRSALILATGLLVFCAGSSQAAPGAAASAKSETAAGASAETKKYTRQGSRHGKKYAQRKSGKAALKSSTGKKATEIADDDTGRSTTIPPSVANANAQLASAEAPADSARAMSAKANTMLLAAADKAGDTRIVAADQPNNVDRTLQDNQAACPDPDDGRGVPRTGDARRAGGGEKQRKLRLGPDLLDRQDLHRLRRAADDGLRGAHVHGVR